MTIPTGFAEDSPGSGYFPAHDGSGFVALDAPDTAGGANTFDQALATVLASLATVLPGYQETNVTRSPGALRVDFVATVDSGPGRGAAYFKEFGPIVCGGTLFLADGSAVPFDATVQALVASLQAVKGAQPRPTATPLPPTPTPVPPTATPKPAATNTPTVAPRATGRTWHGVPLYPNAVLYSDNGDTATYSTTDSSTTVDVWFEREWARLGMTFVMDYPSDGYLFHVYEYRGDWYAFTTAYIGSGLTAISLLHIEP
jgi:hypothetical protein